MLVIIGADEYGEKDVLAIMDGFRENADSWRDLLRGLKKRGLMEDPELAIGDGALGFWTALRDVYPTTREQRCWVHKTANVTGAMPKSLRKKSQGRPAGYLPSRACKHALPGNRWQKPRRRPTRPSISLRKPTA
jgi:hypothetical protein